MQRVLISAVLFLSALALTAFISSMPAPKNNPPREHVLVSIAELVQKESEVTRELHMLKFGHTLNLMDLLQTQQNFEESATALKSILTADFEKRVRELNRVSRHRDKHISDFKSNWAIHRNSRSSVLRVPARIIEESDPSMRAELLIFFHGIERDFLIENDVDRHLRSLPARLSRLEDLVSTHCTEDGINYFNVYKRHLELYISSRAILIEAVSKSEEFSVRPALEKIRDDLLEM